MLADAPHLAIAVQLLDARWHGLPEWPPAPFRLFQALVAAAARGGDIAAEDAGVLRWLEEQAPPRIVAPVSLPGRQYTNYVPNNDLDAVGGDPDKVEAIRVGKTMRPRLIAGVPLFRYVWCGAAATATPETLARLRGLVMRLYQFGRGPDMAFARLEILDDKALKELETAPNSTLHRPRAAGAGNMLAVPVPGSFDSLVSRFAAARQRLQAHALSGKRRSVEWHFSQPPKARSREVCYECPPRRRVYELRAPDDATVFVPWSRTDVVNLVTALRDLAARKLIHALPDRAAEVERFLIGRGAGRQDKARRVRIVPIPSIGHVHAGGLIRRVLVEVPQACPLSAEDVFWAFSGLDPAVDPETGLIAENDAGRRLIDAEETFFIRRHYAIGPHARPASTWRTVTPAALPVSRRGIRGGRERVDNERRAIGAVRAALRHADIPAGAVDIRVRREPFDRNGERAERYAAGRFAANRLWHVEIVFDRPVHGPVLIGDGRYLGLGLMAPHEGLNDDARDVRGPRKTFSASPPDKEEPPRDAVIFRLLGEEIPADDMPALMRALRGALMRIDAERFGGGRPTPLFSGHPEKEKTPLAQGYHAHVFLAAPPAGDGSIHSAYVLAPWVCDRSSGALALAQDERRHFRLVTSRLNVLYGQALPRQTVVGAPPDPADPLVGEAAEWITVTPYVTTRRCRSSEGITEDFFIEDVRRELHRRRLPMPRHIDILDVNSAPQGRLTGIIRLDFSRRVRGPFLLGWGAHRGQGVFARA